MRRFDQLLNENLSFDISESLERKIENQSVLKIFNRCYLMNDASRDPNFFKVEIGCWDKHKIIASRGVQIYVSGYKEEETWELSAKLIMRESHYTAFARRKYSPSYQDTYGITYKLIKMINTVANKTIEENDEILFLIKPECFAKEDQVFRLLKADPDRIVYFDKATKAMQEFAIDNSKDKLLPTKIKNLDEELREKYKYLFNLKRSGLFK